MKYFVFTFAAFVLMLSSFDASASKKCGTLLDPLQIQPDTAIAIIPNAELSEPAKMLLNRKIFKAGFRHHPKFIGTSRMRIYGALGKARLEKLAAIKGVAAVQVKALVFFSGDQPESRMNVFRKLSALGVQDIADYGALGFFETWVNAKNLGGFPKIAGVRSIRTVSLADMLADNYGEEF